MRLTSYRAAPRYAIGAVSKSGTRGSASLRARRSAGLRGLVALLAGEVAPGGEGELGAVAFVVRAAALPLELFGGVGEPAFVAAGDLDEALGGVLQKSVVVFAKIHREPQTANLGGMAVRIVGQRIISVGMNKSTAIS